MVSLTLVTILAKHVETTEMFQTTAIALYLRSFKTSSVVQYFQANVLLKTLCLLNIENQFVQSMHG